MSIQSNDIPEGFKTIDLGPLPKDWEVVNINQSCSFDRGTEPGSSAYNRERIGIPFIRVGNISAQTQELVYTTSSNVKLCDETDILMTFDGSPGVVRKGFKGAYSSGIRKVNPNSSEIHKDYLFFVLQTESVKHIIDLYATGVTIKHASKALPHIKVLLPPLPEQKAIARVLSTIHKAIEAQDKIIIAARELKKSLMRHLFTYGPVPVSEAEQVPLKETEIGRVPEHWGVVRLGKMSELITKGSSPNWQGFEYCDKGIVFIRSHNVGYGRLELEEIAYLPEAFNRKERKSIIHKNDLLINIVGASIGRAAVANEFTEGGNLNQAVALARLKSGLEPSFTMNFLLENDGQAQLHRQKKEIARANLSLQDINNLIVPCPPPPEQREFISNLSAVDKKIKAEENRKAVLQSLFKTMLHMLMTGKVRVKDLEATAG